MTDAAATVTAEPELPRRGRLWSALVLSLLVTGAAAIFAIGPAALLDARWSWWFVMTRWMVVFALLALPLLHQAAARLGRHWSLPWALRTPATALLLTVEGIAWDIITVQLRG